MSERFIIYALTDPMTGDVRYVGRSSRGLQRPAAHMHPRALAKDDTYKGRWLRSLVASGHRPGVRVIAVCADESHLNAAERQWIAYGKASCWPLTNGTDGGEGLCNPPPETRVKMSAAKKGKPGGYTGKRHSFATRTQMAASHTGRSLNAEHRAAIGAGHRGIVRSAEARAATSAALMGHQVSAETRDKLRAAHLGRRASPETRARMAASRNAVIARQKAASNV